ncbi:MAG: YbjN domain-containing protein [Sphaerospermopsis sp. SIO1G2]|nr:YbjN domain-containing protein [Sphaerospermopsis sp. SIO1G1]NET71999.1 YbjN domain-containing protein [Sphaerospermopsis sp. SIO1G2]
MTSNQETLNADEFTDELMEETSVPNHIELIENVISTLEEDNSAMVSETNGVHLWKFKYGSVEVFIRLTGLSDEDTITVWSAVLKLPARDEPRLMRYLLELNCTSTFEARFGIINDQVVVISTRTVAELSPGEISRIITIVATIADDNDEALIEEFGGA